MEAELLPTNITNLIGHTMRLIAADARSRDVQIRTRIEDIDDLPLDANQMTQALLNLLLNALQAVDQNGRIEVGAEFNDNKSCLHLWVEDNGSGITADQKEKVFDRNSI